MRKTYIDTIRAYSVFLVYSFHLLNKLEVRYYIWGAVGVYLFYMISGNGLYSKYGNEIDYKKFFKNRFFRIYPSFWLCYSLVFLFNFWSNKSFPEIPCQRFLLTILGMDGYFSYRVPTFYLIGEWFLGSIILLYLLFPLVRLCVNKNLQLTIAILFGFVCLIFYNNFFGLFQIMSGRNLLVSLFYFVLGIWVEAICQKSTGNIWIYGLGIFAICYAIFLLKKLPKYQS